jgi:hypothetical protein
MLYRRELRHDCACPARPFNLEPVDFKPVDFKPVDFKPVDFKPEVLNTSTIDPITHSGLSQELRAPLPPELQVALPEMLM